MSKPKELTRLDIAAILHSIKDGWLQCRTDEEGLYWWVTEADSEGERLFKLVFDEVWCEIGNTTSELLMRSANTPFHLLLAGAQFLSELHPSELEGTCSVVSHGPNNVVVLRMPKSYMDFNEDGFGVA